MFHCIETSGLSDYERQLYNLTSIVLEAQETPIGQRREASRAARAKIAEQFGKLAAGSLSRAIRRDCSRCRKRLARDAGSWWASLTAHCLSR